MKSSIKHSLSLLLLLSTVTSAVPMADEDPAFVGNDLEQQLEQDTPPKLTRAQRVKMWVKEHKLATTALVVLSGLGIGAAALLVESGVAKVHGKEPLVKRGYKKVIGAPKMVDVYMAMMVDVYTSMGERAFYKSGKSRVDPGIAREGKQFIGKLYKKDRSWDDEPQLIFTRDVEGIGYVQDPTIPISIFPSSFTVPKAKQYNRMVQANLDHLKRHGVVILEKGDGPNKRWFAEHSPASGVRGVETAMLIQPKNEPRVTALTQRAFPRHKSQYSSRITFYTGEHDGRK